MKNFAYATIGTLALVGAMTIGCENPGSGPDSPAGSPGTGTTARVSNTPGLAGTGKMDPANQGTDARNRTDPDVTGRSTPSTRPVR